MIRRRRPLARKKRRKPSRLRRGILLPDGTRKYTGLPVELVKKCPHQIIETAHYRSDGTCRCDDYLHRNMKKWGYKWNAKRDQWE